MTSTPTTPISVRRNNFLSVHGGSGDNDVTATVSRIPLPSPGSFRRSISLRMRGSKGSLVSPTTTTSSGITRTAIPFLSNNSSICGRTAATINKRMMPSSVETLSPARSSSSSTSTATNIIKTSTNVSPSISKNTNLTTSTTTTNEMFRPTRTIEVKQINSSSFSPGMSFNDNNSANDSSCNTHTSFENTNGQQNISLNHQDTTTTANEELTLCSKDCNKNSQNNGENFETNSIDLESEEKDTIDGTLINMETTKKSLISSISPSSSSSSSCCATTAIKPSDGADLKKVISPSNNTKRDPNGMSLNLNGPTSVTPTSSTARTPKTPHTPKTPLTGPLSKATPKTPPVTPDSPHIYLDDDLDSVYSYSSATSGRSTMSCEHPYVARNGTTFSGRKMKYVVHCSSYAGQVGEDYLTPTQRAQKQLRRLKELLTQARQDLEQKDSEILRLTREVVELKLFKASLSSPEDRSNSSDAVTVREATTDLKTSQDVSPIVDMIDEGTTKSSPRHILHSHHGINQVQFLEKMSSSEMQSSFADSGHFEDMTTSSVHSKDSYVHTQDRACGSDNTTLEDQRQELIRMYEKKIEELVKNQETATSEIRRTHNDRVEALLQKLAECNSRYADLVPDYEAAKERIRELEKQLEDLQRKLQEQEEKQKKIYLHMYTKEQEAERIAQADQMLELAYRPSNRVSISELLKQLQSTQDELENIRASNCRSESGSSLLTAKEAISLWVLGARKTIYRRLLEAQENKTKVDPEITLQFLKSAIYYFLTDKDNSQGHLKAIESILEFSEQEKQNISKARSSK